MKQCYRIEASGDDIESLLFHFLDELLFLFSAEPFLICPKLEISKFDLVDFELECLCYGEPFQLGKHPQGTEVKAITYSAMQIIQKSNRNDVYVIIDIWEDWRSKVRVRGVSSSWNSVWIISISSYVHAIILIRANICINKKEVHPFLLPWIFLIYYFPPTFIECFRKQIKWIAWYSWLRPNEDTADLKIEQTIIRF